MSKTVPKAPTARRGRWVEAEVKVRSAGSDRPSGWTEGQAGRPQSVAAGSGVAAGPVCQPWTGSPTGIGRVPGPGRTARLKGPQGPTGTYGKAISPVRGVAPNASVRRQCYWGNGKNGKSCALSPTASRPQTVCQNRLPKSEMATRFKGEEDGKTTMFAQLAND